MSPRTSARTGKSTTHQRIDVGTIDKLDEIRRLTKRAPTYGDMIAELVDRELEQLRRQDKLVNQNRVKSPPAGGGVIPCPGE